MPDKIFMVVDLLGPRSPEAINLLNNKNAWLKMASSVYVVGDKTNEELILTQKSKTKDGKEVINRITVDTDVDEDGIADGIQRLKDIGIPDPEKFYRKPFSTTNSFI